jgi:hypothetical protein
MGHIATVALRYPPSIIARFAGWRAGTVSDNYTPSYTWKRWWALSTLFWVVPPTPWDTMALQVQLLAPDGAVLDDLRRI